GGKPSQTSRLIAGRTERNMVSGSMRSSKSQNSFAYMAASDGMKVTTSHLRIRKPTRVLRLAEDWKAGGGIVRTTKPEWRPRSTAFPAIIDDICSSAGTAFCLVMDFSIMVEKKSSNPT